MKLGHDPTDLRGERDKERRAEEENRARAARDATDFRSIMGTPQGRRFVHRILEEAQVMGSVFNPNAMTMAYAEGRKTIGYWLLDHIEPEEFMAMTEEARQALEAAE